MIIIKTIGIILRNFLENDKKFIGTRKDLFESFYKYDVNVIGIPSDICWNKIINVINMCDGIVLSGGDNFVENDFPLVKYLYENDFPVLGICLGMQSMGRTFSKLQEIDVINHQLKKDEGHYINIHRDSFLYSILNKERIFVNSRHNSALINTSLFISAISDDGIIEAIEDKRKKFFLGVEWHPESLNDAYSEQLFDYFVKSL